MKVFLGVAVACVLALPGSANSTTRYYKEIALVVSFPYPYEGIYPSLSPGSEPHYEFILDEKGYPTRISHFKEGKILSNGPEGWAVLDISYAVPGQLAENHFYDEKGKVVKSPLKGILKAFPLDKPR